VPQARGITWVQFLEDLLPKIWEGKKTVQIPKFFAISDNFRLWSHISETDPQIKHRKSSWSTTTPPTLDEKISWTLVHKRKSYWRAYWPIQVDIFRETTSRPLGVLLPEIFTRAGDWPWLPRAHPNWDGGPPEKFLSWKFKIWLKIQRVHVNKFGTNGDIITNFYQDDVPRARGFNLGTIFGRPAP